MPPNILPTLWAVIQWLNYVIVPDVVRGDMCDNIRSYFVDSGTESIRNHKDGKQGKGQRTQKNFLGGDRGERRVHKMAFLDSVRQLVWQP
jgi:hypothetical protein